MLVVLIGTYLLSLSRWIPGGIVTAIGILLLLVDRLCLVTDIMIPASCIPAMC